MSKPEAILNYQEVDLERQQVETSLRTTEARVRFNKLAKLLKSQQATIKKLSDDLETISAAENRVSSQYQTALKRLDLETSELDTLENDDETTSEEMTEFRHDIERLNREINSI